MALANLSTYVLIKYGSITIKSSNIVQGDYKDVRANCDFFYVLSVCVVAGTLRDLFLTHSLYPFAWYPVVSLSWCYTWLMWCVEYSEGIVSIGVDVDA